MPIVQTVRPTPAAQAAQQTQVYVSQAQSNFAAVSGSAVVPSTDLNTVLAEEDSNLKAGAVALSNQAEVVVVAPGVVQAMSPLQYSNILRTILIDISNRYNVTLDATKLTYKMISGKEDLTTNVKSGIEITTVSTSDTFRIRFYFSFTQITSIRFVKFILDQNYPPQSSAAATIYLYEGTVSKQDYATLLGLIQSTAYANSLPGPDSALLTESGTPVMFLTEDMIPIVLEH